MDNDIYIKALRYAEEKKKFTLQELQFELGLSDELVDQIALQAHHKQIFFQSTSNFYNKYKSEPYPQCFFSVEDKFRLLEHEELNHARESALSATRFAVLALVISAIGSFSSIYFSLQPSTQLSALSRQLTSIESQLIKSSDLLSDIAKVNEKIDSQALNYEKEMELMLVIQEDLRAIKNEIQP
ncbi:hypothetical protein QWY82_19210 [Simiduia curdlanivorans]|uniref:Uncharacterized protein n=1 Tax=Simiduia curdlanivorans TaxID=1492769 RepID=A0ABV8V2W7_9GAMM|nr:hypothetical protein [Simiduia curdlanivorans]MDN3640936.1 hypothetical protein [Simiduia curdlanivorans]